jgi:hypothetical protein
MIRAALVALALLLLPLAPAERSDANLLMAPIVSGSYTGPGDIVAGWKAWYGLRAFSAAVAATGTQKSVNVRNGTTAETCDILIATSGLLGLTANCSGSSSGETPSAFCTSGSCFITEWYDQSGNGNNISQGTAGDQPQLVLSGSYPEPLFNGTSDFLSGALAGGAISQGYTESCVFNAAVTPTANGRIISTYNGSAGSLITFDNGSPIQVEGYAGASQPLTTTTSVLHSIIVVFNDTASGSLFNLDGTETAATFGTNATGASVAVGSDVGGANLFPGNILECGILPSVPSSGQRASLNSNAHSVIGF